MYLSLPRRLWLAASADVAASSFADILLELTPLSLQTVQLRSDGAVRYSDGRHGIDCGEGRIQVREATIRGLISNRQMPPWKRHLATKFFPAQQTAHVQPSCIAVGSTWYITNPCIQ